jgi:Protein NO VEIN, C-terminal
VDNRQKVCVIRSSPDYDLEEWYDYLKSRSGRSYEFDAGAPTPNLVGKGTLLMFQWHGKLLGEAVAREEVQHNRGRAQVPIHGFNSYRELFQDFIDTERLWGENEPFYGRSIFYPLREETSLTSKEKGDLIRFLRYHKFPSAGKTANARIQPDIFKRQEVEKAAVRIVTKHYERRLGYQVSSVESSDLGWDLEAVSGSSKHCLEVKGLSGNEVSVGFTPNEYKALKEKWAQFRICIVNKALTKNWKLRIFSSSKENGPWKDATGQVLTIKRMTGARLYF